MTRRVAILPDAVANQIAAGEVVDRPASVVKELVENSIDAGASEVRIEIEDGGRTLVVVSDNGSGMNRDDAVLALDRHATSKITSASDLIGVGTFGFRGEALPAIASVSRFLMVTADGGGEATEIAVTGGRIDKVGPTARQQGTSVTVRSLFYNTPARRKFLRSTSSETRAAWETVGILALAHPDVGFEFRADGHSRLQVPRGQSTRDRLAAVWGADVVATLVPVSYAIGSVRVEGLIQRPSEARPTGRRTQLFVNGRPFRDPFLIRAAEAGYRSAIAPGDRPTMLLLVEVPPADVDVNVHPAKLEVRFREKAMVERALEEGVRDALGKLAAAAPLRPPSGWIQPAASEATRPVIPEELGLPVSDGVERAPAPPSFHAAVIQLQQTYLVYDGPEGINLVDQHSAHERVLYERAMESFAAGELSSQRLLLPIAVELVDEELDAVESFRDELVRVGFEVEPFGGRSVVLHAVPAPHPRFDATQCFREMIADLARGRFGGWANRLERFAATYACRAAVKAGTALTEPEMRRLLSDLFASRLPPHDVHGRSTIVTLGIDELERRFGRR